MAKLRDGRFIATVVVIAVLSICISIFFKKTLVAFSVLKIPHWPVSPPVGKPHPSINQILLSGADAWVLQVADFKLQENLAANALTQSLRQKGYKAYMRQVNLPTGSVIQVFVGPEIKLSKIKTLANLLKKETQLNPQIIAFNPLIL